MKLLDISEIPGAIESGISFVPGLKFVVTEPWPTGWDGITRRVDFTKCVIGPSGHYECYLEPISPPTKTVDIVPATPDVIDEATLCLLSAVEEMLCGSDIRICAIGNKLESACESAVWDTHRRLEKITKKVLRRIDKLQADVATQIEGILTKLASAIEYLLSTMEWQLTQIAIKCGVLPIGDNISTLINISITDMHGPTNCPTVNIDFSQCAPYFVRLINVLVEIRDCLCPTKPPLVPDDKKPLGQPEMPTKGYSLTADEEGNPLCSFVEKLTSKCEGG